MRAIYGGTGPRGATAERRVYVRVPFRLPVTVRGTAGGPAVEAMTTDLSLGGVGFYGPTAFRRGEVVVVAFRLDDPRLGVREERVAGRVAHVRDVADPNRIGVEFLEPLHPTAHPALTRTLSRL